MMSSMIEGFVRPNIRALQPYQSARHEHQSGILLDANENSFGSIVGRPGLALNRYPDPAQKELRRKIASLKGVSEEQVFVGVGSDEALDVILRIFCVPGRDNVIIPEPTYGMYRVAANIHDVEVRASVLTDDFQLDLPHIRSRMNANTRVVFACSPNNPTGNVLTEESLRSLCNIPSIVVIDEAYADFSGQPTFAGLTAQCENVVVLGTLSKAWGLAAIRCGYAIAHPSVIQWMMRVKAPYNMNAVTASIALEALHRPEQANSVIQAIRSERERLRLMLQSLASVATVFPSDANFLLVRCVDADRIYAGLIKKGIIVRNRSKEPKCGNCLRVTVGTREENDNLLNAWKEIAP